MNNTHIGRYCDAFLCAIENARDAGMTPTLPELDEMANGYIRDNLARCTCSRGAR